MALTTFQKLTLRSMQEMTPSQQSTVARFAASLAKKRPNRKAKSQEYATQVNVPGRSAKTQYVPDHLKRSHPITVAEPPKSPRPGIVPRKKTNLPAKTISK